MYTALEIDVIRAHLAFARPETQTCIYNFESDCTWCDSHLNESMTVSGPWFN